MTVMTARRYDTGEAVKLSTTGDAVTGLERADGSTDLWVAPGLVDLQVNGFAGQEFTDAALTLDRVVEISLALDRFGVTCYLPTLTTNSSEILSHSLATIARAIEDATDVTRRVPGIHLEGPYISREDGPRGAHPLEHCRPPDWEQFCRFQDAARGCIRLLTMSPEYDDSASFIRQVVASGVVVAIGHTNASSDQITAAVDAGATLSTHLGNGAHPQIRRHPNYIWDQLADDRLAASLIADAHHLPPAVVKSFVRVKSPARCILVSDITGMAGMPPGRYTTPGLGAVEVLPDGKLVVGGQRELLAGASLPITTGIGNVMRFANVSLRDAVDMAGSHARTLLGLPQQTLDIAQPADLVVFRIDGESALQVVQTVNQGEEVFVAR